MPQTNIRNWIKIRICILSILCFSIIHTATTYAQSSPEIKPPTIELPDSKYIFTEDSKDFIAGRKKQIEAVIQIDPPRSKDLDFKAPEVELLKDKHEAKGKGGVTIAGEGLLAQADEGTLNTETKQSNLEGNVLITSNEGVLSAHRAHFNFDTEVGEFENAEFTLEEGGYEIEADKVNKISEFSYELFESALTTCHCTQEHGLQENSSGEYKPWEIVSQNCNITQEGYAHCYDTHVNLFGAPVFYSPYLGFPVKSERTSGLLVPEFGYSSRDGVMTKIPLFMVLDDSTDTTLTPFIETQTRTGFGLDARKIFSKYNKFSGRLVYSDESARGDSLRGVVTGRTFDHSNLPFDEDRFGAFYNQEWTSSPESELNMGLISDIHLVSDDLFLREMEDNQIGEPQTPHTISAVRGSIGLGEFGNAEIGGEYNQSLIVDSDNEDDTVLQRLPDARVDALQSFRPFGFNPYGVKLVTKGTATSTRFERKEGYDGWRNNISPSLSIPFHFKNYVNGSLATTMHKTYYNLQDTLIPGTTSMLDDTNSRLVPQSGMGLSTGLEKVYEVEEGGVLSVLTSLGSKSQALKLRRVKHAIEPFTNFVYVPDTSQNELPFFDDLDRIRERAITTYGVRTSLLGRFVPPRQVGVAVPELAPRLPDLPAFSVEQPLEENGGPGINSGFIGVGVDRGEIRELASLIVQQSYDYKEDQDDAKDGDENNDPLRSAWSDVGIGMGVYPTQHFSFGGGANYSGEDHNLSSWNLLASFRDDRGDAIRSRVTYIRGGLSQIEGNAEVALLERLKLGYYARYDDIEGEVIEQRLGFRVSSACDCWYFDMGFRDTINPDKQSFLVSFTFGGLGAISQDVLLRRAETS